MVTDYISLGKNCNFRITNRKNEITIKIKCFILLTHFVYYFKNYFL